MMNQAIPEIESILKQLEIIASQEVAKIPSGADGDALRSIARGLEERYANLLATCQTLAGDLKHAHAILMDLQLSREPDTERMYMDLMTLGKYDPATAWDLAKNAVAFRNKKRLEK